MALLWGHEWQFGLQCEIMGSTNSKAYKCEMAILWVNPHDSCGEAPRSLAETGAHLPWPVKNVVSLRLFAFFNGALPATTPARLAIWVCAGDV